jgi:hypothetical protein
VSIRRGSATAAMIVSATITATKTPTHFKARFTARP